MDVVKPTELVDIPTKKQPKKREKPINKQLIASLLAQGYRKPVIAEQAECCLDTIYDIQAGLEKERPALEEFLKNRNGHLQLEQKKKLEFSRALRESLEKDLVTGRMKPSEKGKVLFYNEQGFGIFWDKEHQQLSRSGAGVTIFQVFMGNAIVQV